MNFKHGYSKTLFYFGILEFLLGLSGLLFTALNAQMAGFSEATYPILKMVGALTMAFGYYYIQFGRLEDANFARLSIHVRLALTVFWVVMIAMGILPVIMAGLIVYDLLGALWTRYELAKHHTQAAA